MNDVTSLTLTNTRNKVKPNSTAQCPSKISTIDHFNAIGLIFFVMFLLL